MRLLQIKRNTQYAIRTTKMALFTIAMISLAPPLFAAVTYEDSLVAYWDFDEGSGTVAGDAAGVNDGTVYGSTWTTGQYGNALSFDGVNDYVNPSYGINLNESYTLSYRFKAIDLSGETHIIGSYDDTGGYKRFYAFYHDGSTAKVNIGLGETYAPIFSPNTDEWYFVTFAHDGNGNVDTYINNSHLLTYTYTPISFTLDILIGAWVYNNNPIDIRNYFNGLIDDVAIWNRALDADEVSSICNIGVQGFEGILNGINTTFGALGYTTAQIDQLSQLYADGDTLAELVFDDVTWTYEADTLPDDTGYEIGDSWTTGDGRYCVKLGSGLLGTPLGAGGSVPELPVGAVPFLGAVLGIVVRFARKK